MNITARYINLSTVGLIDAVMFYCCTSSVCLSVCPSVTLVSRIELCKYIINFHYS